MLTNRSDILPVDISRIPQALKDAPRWTIWKAEPKPDGEGRMVLTKVPYRADRPHARAKCNDPTSWSTFEVAHATYLDRESSGADGLFFALGDGFAAVDIDNSVDPGTAEPNTAARAVIDEIGSYAERSVSGGGIRIFAFGPETKGIRFGNMEVYSRYRFMTVTGQQVPGTPPTVERCDASLDALRERLTRERLESYLCGRGARHGRTPAGGSRLEDNIASALAISDDEIVDTGFELDGFAELWRGDTDAYDGDTSRADLALAGRLAFLCGPGQHERVRRLMEQSGLVREKWFTHRTYLMELTIARAYEGRTEYYSWDITPVGFGDAHLRRARQAAAAGPESGAAETALTTVEPGRPGESEPDQSIADLEDGRPTIVLGPETDAIVRELECHLAQHLYQQNGRLVRVERVEGEAADLAVRRPNGTYRIVAVPPEMSQRLLSRYVRFVSVTTTGRGKSRKTITKQVAAPANIAKLFTNCGGWANIPRLVGITSTPFIRRDGVIVATPGYDPVSGYLFIDDGTEWQSVPDQPTDEEVRAAIDALHEVVCDFPFERPEHRSAWLATLLATVGRPAIDGPVPMLWVDGNRKGTGKSQLPRLISAIACGHDPTEIGFTNDEKELENRLASLLLAGDRIAAFDNATGSLRNAVLDRFLTSTVFSTRLFFKQQFVKLLNNTVLAVTGNNLTLRGDLSRRVVRVRLVTPLERPDRRDDFRHPDLFGFVNTNRPRLFAAALTILRAHAVAGFPHPTVQVTKPDGTTVWEAARPVGSFREWDTVIRHAMLRAGLQDPAVTQDEAHDEDEGDTKLREFFRAWYACKPDLAGTATEIIATIMEDRNGLRISRQDSFEPTALTALRQALFELTDTDVDRMPCSKTLGYRLKEARDKKIGGYRLERGPKSNKGITYRLVADDEAAARDAMSDRLEEFGDLLD
jgi:hypothetical protein